MQATPDDTIAAIATPIGAGGLGVIRVSGPHAVAIVRAMFRDRHGRAVERLPSHRVRFGNIIHPRTGATLDEVLVTYMRAPHSYTREDVVEISGHGGIGVMARILEALVASGARLAEPGEFTKRAFLNGRLDLSQAEAVIDLIQAQTEESQRQALAQLQGGLSQAIGAMREELLEVLAYVEGAMEFPEEDLELLPWDTLRAKAACRGGADGHAIGHLSDRPCVARGGPGGHRGTAECRQIEPVQCVVGGESRHRHADSGHDARCPGGGRQPARLPVPTGGYRRHPPQH